MSAAAAAAAAAAASGASKCAAAPLPPPLPPNILRVGQTDAGHGARGEQSLPLALALLKASACVRGVQRLPFSLGLGCSLARAERGVPLWRCSS